jgi:ABC-type uncharacterized transport system substrate-binding protein
MRYPVANFSIGAFIALLFLILFGGKAVEAHPHIWVTAASELLFSTDGSLTGVRHTWTFDGIFSSNALWGIETKIKGVYTREELQPLAQTNVEALKQYSYFSFVKANGERPTFESPVDYFFDYKDNHLTLYFTLPLKTHVKSKTFFLEIVDRSFFFDIRMAEKDAVKLVNAPPGCRASILRPMGDRWMALGLSEETFREGGANVTLGLLFDNKIAVDC